MPRDPRRPPAAGLLEAAVGRHVPLSVFAYATTVVAVSAVSLLAPVLPELAADYGVPVESMAWIQSAVILPGVVSAAALMQAARRVGVMVVLAVSLLLYGAGAANFLHDSFELAIALRLLQGVGGGALLAASFALIGRLPEERRLPAIARNTALVNLMMVLQPLIGAALGQLSPRGPYLFYLSGLLLAPLVLSRRAHVPVHALRSGRQFEAGTGRTVGAVLALTVVANAVLFGWLLYLVPVYLAEVLGLAVTERGLVLALQSGSGALLALASQRLLHGRREASLLMAAALLTVVAFPTVALSDHLAVAVAALFLAGGSFGLANPALAALVTEAGPEAGTGWWQSATKVGQLGGPVLGAALLTVSTVQVALTGGAVAGALGVAGALAVRSTRRGHGRRSS